MRSGSAVDGWIEQEAIPFSLDDGEDGGDSLDQAVDRLMAALDPSLELLGFGEALHGGEHLLALRNRLFQRLVEAHGFSAIAVESSFPRGRLTNGYVTGRGASTYDEIRDTGFSNRFGQLEANRELLQWMRRYNERGGREAELHFYGFDFPLHATGISSPRPVLAFVLDYLEALEVEGSRERRARIEELTGADDDWENVEALTDSSKSIGDSPAARELRREVEALITELRVRRPELVAAGGRSRYDEALHEARLARQLLNYHAGMATGAQAGTLLGIRDAVMADNLSYIVERERGRGKVLAFAHNSHLQRGQAVWPWYTFWPVGAQLEVLFGPRYAVIGSALALSEENGIGEPEPGTLEARLSAAARPGGALFLPINRSPEVAAELEQVPERSGSTRNLGYLPLKPQRLSSDFDAIAFVESTPFSRGWPPLP